MHDTEISFTSLYSLRKALRSAKMALQHCHDNPRGLSRLILQTLPNDIERLRAEIERRRKRAIRAPDAPISSAPPKHMNGDTNGR